MKALKCRGRAAMAGLLGECPAPTLNRLAGPLLPRCSIYPDPMRAITVLDAPSNLGLRPPAPGLVPGCYKLAGALRDQRLLERLGGPGAGLGAPPPADTPH